KTNGNAFIGK
nr:Chain C, Nucleoprotein peptide KTNGNAFIGK [Influenza B virus]7S8Q_F Chain F, Nucleoprotein peptide KTNGNAFIGK [Influenza B virus]